MHKCPSAWIEDCKRNWGPPHHLELHSSPPLHSTILSLPITRVSVTCRPGEKTETTFSLHQVRFFSLKYWQFHIYRKLWKSDPLLAESFTAMDLSADSPVHYCFSPNADEGLLCSSHCGHILIQKQMLKLACPDFSYRKHHCYTAVAVPTYL